MARHRFIVDLGSTEVALMIAEFSERAAAFGLVEAEHRVGREIDDAFFRSCTEVVPALSEDGKLAVNIRPSVEFNRALAAISTAH